MAAHDFNPYSDPVARQLYEANDQLRAINEHLWEANQPPEVRVARQNSRAEQARATLWGLRLVVGLAAGWVILSLVFGQTGARLFGSVLSFLLDAVGVLLVLGGVVWVGALLWRGARWVSGRGEGTR